MDNVHSTMTRSSRLPCIVSNVINKPTTFSCVYYLSTDDLLWRNFLSPQCRNCSRDPDHAHLGSTHSSLERDFTWPTRVQNLKSLALAAAEMYTPLYMGCKILKRAMVSQCTKYEVSRFTRYEAVNGGAKCRKRGG